LQPSPRRLAMQKRWRWSFSVMNGAGKQQVGRVASDGFLADGLLVWSMVQRRR
ncbi:hypothetical protein Dimus_005149, partial [Dionaea muscipula]